MNDWFINFTDSNFYEESKFFFQQPFDELINIDFNDSTLSSDNSFNQSPQEKEEEEEENFEKENSPMIFIHARFFFIRTMKDCLVLNNYIAELEKQGYSYETYQFECAATGMMIIISYNTEIDVEYID